MGAQSLTMRMAACLFVSQFIAAFIPWIILAAYAFVAEPQGKTNAMLEHYTFHRIRELVAESLTVDAEGRPVLRPSDAMKRRSVHDPQLEFAAMSLETGVIVPGSAPALAPRMAAARDADAREMRFYIPVDRETKKWGLIAIAATPTGRYYIAAGGFTFVWSDVVNFIVIDKDFETVVFLVGWVLSCSITYLALRHALSSLRRAAVAAEGVDLDSLGQGIPIASAPDEIKPIIAAMNGALARLDGSVAQLRRFTANAAHELRTPLAIMQARLDNSEPFELRNALIGDASRIHAIVEQLLASARLSAKQTSVDDKIDLTDAVAQVVADHSPLARRSERMIAFECEGEQVMVRGNRRMVQSVVANLVDNAIRAEPVGGTVLVRIRRDAMVEIIDHGQGVDQADRELIFEPFWRKSDSTPGTGLGLAIAKELMASLSGRIWLECSSGGGSTFKLAFAPI
jgi:signal transduction histidine kinase